MTQPPSAPQSASTPFPRKKIAAARGPELRQDRAVRTRKLVLTKAAELFAAHGFRETSVKDVAEAAELTKGAVYFHFPNKEALAVAVVEEHYACWPQILAEVGAEELPPLETAIAMLDRAALAFRDNTVVQGGARLQIERPQIDAELPTPFVDWTSFLTALLTQARDQGQIRADAAPDAAARALVAGFFGTQHISDVLHQRTDLGDRWPEVRDLLLRALRP